MKIKNSILAGCLNLIFPGLGALYVGEWKSAILSLLLGFILGGSLFLMNSWLVRSEPPWPLFICPSLSALLYAIAMFTEGQNACRLHNNKVVSSRKQNQ